MSNNVFQNMGMQMPMFAAANQQQSSNEDVDLHDIFADYFNEDLPEPPQNPNNAANAAFAQQQAQGLSLPTGQGIKTAWHAGSLPSMQSNSSSQVNPPAMKRSRAEENLLLPTAGQTMAQPQIATANSSPFQAQQLMLASSAQGGSALTGRLGFPLANIGTSGATVQGIPQQNLASLGANNINMSIGNVVGAGGSLLGASIVSNTSTAGMLPLASMQWGATNRNAISHMQYGVPIQLVDKTSIEEQMTAERRLRNREHAKRSRVRKKFMLESLQQQVRGLQEENSTLRMLVQKHIPQQALKIIDECCSKSPLFGGGTEAGLTGKNPGLENDTPKAGKTELVRSDYSLIESLTSGQQNFVLSDPRLPDNPIVFASPGFYELTGYTRDQVLGRNCRFLQGTGTDSKAVDVIRTAIANGTDATTCLLNYKADGTPFWNQLFVAALRDADNCIVNYVGVQTLIEPNAGASALEDKVNAAHPLQIGVEEDDKDNDT